MSQQIVRINGIKWWVSSIANGRVPTPLCPDHNLRMVEYPEGQIYSRGILHKRYASEALKLECAEGPHYFVIPREFAKEQKYVLDRIDAKIFTGMQVVNLDDEAVPIAKESVGSKDGKYFLVAQLMESKRGLQMVVYAGEKGKSGKTQIFIEPEIKRLAFDQKDLHPSDVFSELKVTFDDGTTHMVKGGEK